MTMPEDWIEIKSDKAHISRERKKAAELRKTNWWKNVLQTGKCHYCGNSFPSSEITMDHIVPLSRGGKSAKGNIVPCCKECNNKKKYLTPVEIILKDLEKRTDG